MVRTTNMGDGSGVRPKLILRKMEPMNAEHTMESIVQQECVR